MTSLSVSHGPWPGYEGIGIPANSEFDCTRNLKIQDKKINDFWQRQIYFEVILKHKVTGEIIEINPPFKATCNLDPRINLYEDGKLIFEEKDPSWMGQKTTFTWTTVTENESEFYKPGYILYEHALASSIQGTVVSCDSVDVSQEVELKFPYKLGFRVNPEL